MEVSKEGRESRDAAFDVLKVRYFIVGYPR